MRADPVDEEGDENHDEIEGKGHPEHGQGNKENVVIVSLTHNGRSSVS
jgi:hypothetical protein